jgi:hypothetical protein
LLFPSHADLVDGRPLGSSASPSARREAGAQIVTGEEASSGRPGFLRRAVGEAPLAGRKRCGIKLFTAAGRSRSGRGHGGAARMRTNSPALKDRSLARQGCDRLADAFGAPHPNLVLGRSTRAALGVAIDLRPCDGTVSVLPGDSDSSFPASQRASTELRPTTSRAGARFVRDPGKR